MLKISDFIIPDWPAPAHVHSVQTTRQGGVSTGPFASLNLGNHVQDDPLHVAHNRQLLSQFVPSEPVWLNQVHGIEVVDAADVDCEAVNCIPSADASFTTRHNTVCVTMTADCLTILLCDIAGTVVASIHGGWRSLCGGVIEGTITKILTSSNVKAGHLMAWLGPAIGPTAFEVGSEVRAQFVAKDAQAESAFQSQGNGKWLGNIYSIATQRLNKLGVSQVFGGQHENFCTFSDSTRFFSFRRDNVTGRMATMIWLTAPKLI